jgi:hypothetical protein
MLTIWNSGCRRASVKEIPSSSSHLFASGERNQIINNYLFFLERENIYEVGDVGLLEGRPELV